MKANGNITTHAFRARPAFGSRGPLSRRAHSGAMRPMLGNPGETEQRLGIAVLSALSIASVHSSICPSYFTMSTFASQPEARKRAMDGLWISLGLSTLAAGAIYMVWKDLAAALVGEATAFALFGIGVYAINQKPPTGIPPIEQQNTTSPA